MKALKLLTCTSMLLAGSALASGEPHSDWSYYANAYLSSAHSSFAYAGVNDHVTTSDEGSEAIMHLSDTVNQDDLGGGVAVGFRHAMGHDQYVGFEINQQLNTSKAELNTSNNLSYTGLGTDDYHTLPLNIDQEFRLKSQLNFFVTYGFEMTHQNWLYVKAGPSVARLKESALSSIDFFEGDSDAYYTNTSIQTSSSSKHIRGLGVGLGLQHQLTDHLSFVAEYDYFYYGKHNISTLSQAFTLTEDNDDEDDIVSTGEVTRKVKVASSAVKLGFSYDF